MRFHPAAAVVLVALSMPAALASPAQATAPRCGGKDATIVGSTGSDVLTGTAGDDVIAGLSGGDAIDGGGGDDVICGGSGRDVIDGGPGADRLYGGPAIDRLTGGSGDDYLAGAKGQRTDFRPGPGDDRMSARQASATLDYSAAPGPVTVDLAAGTADGWGHDTLRLAVGMGAQVTGSAFDDTLLGSGESDRLSGGGGTDKIDGRGSGDAIRAAAGELIGGGGDDWLVMTSSASPGATLDGGVGDDSIEAPADAVVDAGAGSDVLRLDASGGVGTSGPTVSGGAGQDDLEVTVSTPGSPFLADLDSGLLEIGGVTGSAPGFEDFLVDGKVSSVDVTGTDGPNEITVGSRVGAVPATVRGLDGNDDIWGAAGDDTLLGGRGDDYLSGLGGDDALDGGPGHDSANGGAGTDTCTAVEDTTDCE